MKKLVTAIALVLIFTGAGISTGSMHADDSITTKDKTNGLG